MSNTRRKKTVSRGKTDSPNKTVSHKKSEESIREKLLSIVEEQKKKRGDVNADDVNLLKLIMKETEVSRGDDSKQSEKSVKKRTFSELCKILEEKSDGWVSLKNGLVTNYKKMLEYKKNMYSRIMEENYANIKRQLTESEETARVLLTDDLTGKTTVEKQDLRIVTGDVRDKHYTIATDVANRRRIQTFLEEIKRREDGQELKLYEENIYSSILEAAIEIAGLIGESRKNVRDEIANLIFIMSNSVDIFTKSFVNICITGSAGSGKTTVSNVISKVFQKCGFLLNADNSRIISPKDLTGSYLGESGKKTVKQLTDNLESVMFIDEAYGIMACMDKDQEKPNRSTGKQIVSFANQAGGGDVDGRSQAKKKKKKKNKKSRKEIDARASSFGYESITEFVNFLDKRMGLIVVIVAGYEDSMKNCFFAANEGLDRRFPIRMRLADYTSNDLANLLVNRLKELNPSKPELFEDSRTIGAIYKVVAELNKAPKFFSNQAGDIINLATFISKYIASTSQDQISVENLFKAQVAAGFEEYASFKGLKLSDVLSFNNNT